MSRPLNDVKALEKVEDLEGVLRAINMIALAEPETEHSCRRALRQIRSLARESYRTRPAGELVTYRPRTTLADQARSSN
jgi:uncharacterized Fe-S cluster-containing protein